MVPPMSKKYSGLGVLVLALASAGLYFVANNGSTNQDQNIINSATSTLATSTEVIATEPEDTDSREFSPKYTEMDLTKLQGKDRLYTEEEGLYENLSEEERKLVDAMICNDNHQFTRLCGRLHESSYISYIDYISIISLYNGIAVISMPHSGIKSVLYIYDIQNQEILGRYTDSWNTAFGPNYIIRRGENYISEHKFNGWTLELYRPGMTNFVTIPDSNLELDLSYLEWKEMILRDFPIIFDGDIITVTIHRHECDESDISLWAGLPLECTNIIQGTKTFDLSNLP